MALFDKYKHKGNIDWNIDTKDWEYLKISDMPLEKEIPIQGFFITPDNGYGKGCVVILNDNLLNIPNRYVEQMQDMLEDADIIEAIKNHLVGIRITTFIPKKFKNKVGYDVEFVELETPFN